MSLASLARPSLAGYYSGPVYDSTNGNCQYTSDYDSLSIPYQVQSDGSMGNGYFGGGGETNPSITCSGEITATFTWVPDGDGDNPPENILVAETCYAKWQVESDFGGTGTADNGLGFDETEINGPPIYGGTSSGTRYSIVPGTTTIVLHCSPSANVSSFMGDVTASVGYTAAAAPLDIMLSGGIGTNYAKRYLIGQRVTATFDGAFLEADPNTEQWSATGPAPFLNYVVAADSSTGTYTPMSTQTTDTFNFYFAKQGTGTITCTATLVVPAGALPAGGLPVTVQRNCQVDVPDDTVTPSIGSTKIRLDPDNSQWLDLDMNPTSPNGTLWQGHVRTDPAYTNQYGAGTWCFTQLWTPERTVVKNGQSLHWSTNGTTGLDSGFPYLGASFPDDGSNHTLGDRPQLELQPVTMTSAAVSDSFTTYVMYRPPGPGSVYVPLRYWTWSWIGATSRPSTIADWGDPTDESVLGAPGDYPAHPTWTTQIDPNGGTMVP